MLPILVRAAGRPTTIAFAAGLLVGLLVASSATTYLLPPGSEEAFITTRVVRVIDGDTVELASGERVRYVGLDTPEMGKEMECGAQEATDFNRRLVEGKQVKLLEGPEDTDSFGRLLRYVFVDEVFVNTELVRTGHAIPRLYHPEEPFGRLFAQLGQNAKAAGHGSWAKCAW